MEEFKRYLKLIKNSEIHKTPRGEKNKTILEGLFVWGVIISINFAILYYLLVFTVGVKNELLKILLKI